MFFLYLLGVVATGFAGWRAWRRTRFFLHVFQLETYKPDRYERWVRQRKERYFTERLSYKVAGALLALSLVGFAAGATFWTAVVLLAGWSVAFASSRLYRSEQEKKPLAFTPRMQRLLGATAAITLFWPVTGFFLGVGNLFGLWWYLLGWGLADLGAPVWVWAAARAVQPVEKSIQESFKRQAREKIRSRPDLTVVGVTGSYGKTSTKFIIEEILQQKYSVLATPSSYNTPMGLCLAINEKLRPEHQVLVLEYGIRYPGDIAELCEIVQPDISVLTTIGVAHLETMGSQENIAREKGSLLELMVPGGTAVLNIGDERVAQQERRATGDVWRVAVADEAPRTNGQADAGNASPAGVSTDFPDADLVATNLRYGQEGARFEVRERTGSNNGSDGEEEAISFQTRLLGRHNALNLLLGTAVGREMGLRLRQIAHAVGRVEPVEHRLELREEHGVTIIDDAFNSNPVGARNAVEILGQLGEGRRVIVTPGMVELGERQHEENRAFGEHLAASNVDLAVLVGEEQTHPIQEGLRSGGFPNEKTRVVGDFFDAQDVLKGFLKPGDVVLYENDLPDQYDQ